MYIKLSYLIPVFDSISNVGSISIMDVTKRTKKIFECNLRLFMVFCSVHKYEDLIGQENKIISY